MDDSLGCIFGLVLFAGIIFGTSAYVKKAEEKIKNDLERKSCTEIEITRTWMFKSLSFDIKYRNQPGQLVSNSCIVANGFFHPVMFIGKIHFKLWRYPCPN